MKDTTRRSLLAAGGAVAIGSVAYADQQTSSTSSDQNESDPMPENETQSQPAEASQNLVRVAHLAPDVGDIAITANGARGFESVERLEQSEYTTYQPNAEYDIVIRENGEPILETAIELASGPVTLAFVGEQCRQSDRPLQLLVLNDDNSTTESGMCRMQTVHASPDAPEFDVRTESGETLVSKLSFGESALSDVSTGEYVVGVHTDEHDDPLFRFKMEFEEDMSYTVYAAGYTDMSNAPSAVPDDYTFKLGVSGGTEPTIQ